MADHHNSDAWPRGWTGVALSAVIHAVLGLGLYLLFAGQVSHNELVTGGLLAVVAAGWALALRASCGARFTVSAAHLRPWLRSLGAIPGAIMRTGWALLAVIAGRASPRTEVSLFIHGPADEPQTNARRATAVLAASLAPDSFVVRTLAGKDRVLIHRLTPAQRAPDPLWLV